MGINRLFLKSLNSKVFGEKIREKHNKVFDEILQEEHIKTRTTGFKDGKKSGIRRVLAGSMTSRKILIAV
jgi:hypothetical protein